MEYLNIYVRWFKGVKFMKRLTVFVLIILVMFFPAVALANADTFITFDPPGSTGTFPSGINPAGAITGTYFDASGGHGFLRTPHGTFTKFDVPGAAGEGTFAFAINPAGAITGIYHDASNAFHGFLRSQWHLHDVRSSGFRIHRCHWH